MNDGNTARTVGTHWTPSNINRMAASSDSSSCRFPGFRRRCAQTFTPWSMTTPSGSSRFRRGASCSISSASSDSVSRAVISSFSDLPFFFAEATSRSSNDFDRLSFIQPGGGRDLSHLSRNSVARASSCSPSVRPEALACRRSICSSSSVKFAMTSFTPGSSSPENSCSLIAPAPLASHSGDTSRIFAIRWIASGRGFTLLSSYRDSCVAATPSAVASSSCVIPWDARAETIRSPMLSDVFINVF